MTERGIFEGEMDAYLVSYSESHGTEFPFNIGEDFSEEAKTDMLLYLVCC